MGEWVIGKNPVIETLKGDIPINKIWIAEGALKGSAIQITRLAKEKGIIVQSVPRQKLDEMVENTAHQGVVASIAAYDYVELDHMIEESLRQSTTPCIVMLDEINDPHNLGAIIRTADVAGIKGIIIPKRRAVGLTATVAKASAGAIAYVPVARVTNLVAAIEALKMQGFWIVGTDVEQAQDYRTLNYDFPVVLVIGNEGKGIGHLIKKKCDYLIKLPMVGKVQSLNASVAAGILMYEIFNKQFPLKLK